jgi:hypothetical protein
MISSYKKDFPWKKNGPNLPHFTDFLFQIARVFMISEVCSQIWLNRLMDDHQFSYIKKLKKKPLDVIHM